MQHTRDDDHLKGLLDYIRFARGIDFSRYRQATISRKLELRLQETGSRDYAEYLAYLKANPEELQALIRTLTIKVSNFFRNSLVFELLYSTVVPELIADAGFLRVWSVGCANGEEPYSVAMIAHELRAEERLSFGCRIRGTDVDPDAIAHAQKGEYSEEQLFETKRKYVERYFSRISLQHSEYGHDQYRLHDDIRSMVLFSVANMTDLLKERPAHETFNLILCRNVLIYFYRELQEQILKAMKEMLCAGGYLVIGEAETIPERIRHMFEQPFPGIKIFRKLPLSTAD